MGSPSVWAWLFVVLAGLILVFALFGCKDAENKTKSIFKVFGAILILVVFIYGIVFFVGQSGNSN